MTSTPILTGNDDYAAKVAANREAERQSMIALRARLLAAARHAGAAEIITRYEGGSDNGAINEITAHPADADARLSAVTIDCPRQVYDHAARSYRQSLVPAPFTDALETFMGWLITEQHGNWWDGDIESAGEVTWHIADDPDRITGEHAMAIRQTEYTDWEEDRGDDDDLPPTSPAGG